MNSETYTKTPGHLKYFKFLCLFLTVIFIGCGRVSAIYYLQDGFNFPAGTQLGSNSPWLAPTNKILVSTNSLSWSNLATFSPAGNGVYSTGIVSVATYRPFTTPASNGAVYASFLIDITTPVGNSYICGMSQFTNSGVATTANNPCDFIDNIRNSTNGGVVTTNSYFGVRAFATGTVYSTTNNTNLGPSGNLALGTTALMVIKYNFTNGVMSAYFNPAPGSAEPTVPDIATVVSNKFAPDLSYFYFRNGAGASTVILYDSLRIASTWSEVTPPAGATEMLVTLPGQTIASGVGNSGTVTAQTAGSPFTITLSAVDADGVTVDTNYSGSKTISYVGPNGTPTYTTPVSFVNGQAVGVPITLTKAQTTTLTATDGTLTGLASSSLTVNPASIAAYLISIPTQPLVDSAPFTIGITAYDTYSNLVNNATGTNVTLSSNSRTVSFVPNPVSLTNGLASVSVTDSTPETISITATDAAGKTGTVSGIVIVGRKLLITLPGQTFTSGSGNSGTPTAQVAGAPFTVKIEAVDNNYATDSTYTGTFSLAFSGPAAGTYLPNSTSVAFTNGFGVATITLNDATATALATTDGSRGALTSSTFSVSPAAYTQLLVLLPGETAAPGTSTGKSGVPNSQTAGVGFTLTVMAADAYFNAVPISDSIIVAGDAYAKLPGTTTFAGTTLTLGVTNEVAGSGKILTVTDTANSFMASSASYVVNKGTFAGLVLLAPGEVETPGAASGKTGVPVHQTQGAPYTVTVEAVDAGYNLLSTPTDTIQLTSSDTTAGLPSNKALVAGTVTLVITNNGFGTITITAADVSQPSIASGTSTLVVDQIAKYQSISSGSWESTNTWEISYDGTNWLPAFTTPNSYNADTIVITNGYTVTINTNETIDQVTVASGSALTIAATTITVTLANGVGTDLDVYGTLFNGGTITPATGATLAFESGAVYQHTRDGGIIPTASWDLNSTCEVIGVVSTIPTVTSFTQAFGNFIWNCPAQTAEISLAGDLKNAKGNLTVISTGSSQLDLAKSGFSTGTINLGGDFIIQGGIVYIYSSAATSGTIYFNVGGNVAITGGTLGAGTNINAFSILTFTNSSVKTFTGGGTFAGPIEWTVAPGAALDLRTNMITGVGSFLLNTNATLITANPNGFAGNLVIPSTNVILSGGATFIYDAAAAQSGDTLLPSPIGNLIISNLAGVTLAQPVTVTNLTLSPGGIVGTINFDASGALTILGTNSTISGNVAMNGAGVVVVDAAASLPALKVTGGTLNFSGGTNTFTVLGSVLQPGSYVLANAAGGTVTGTPASPAIVNGAGLPPALYGLSQVASGNLYLNVPGPQASTLNYAPIGDDGNFHFSFHGSSGQSYSILASTNLMNWTVVGSGVFGSNSVMFTDTNVAAFPARYFEVRLP